MREIKFRAKRYGDKSWVYGNLYQGTKEGEQYSIILNDAGYHVAPQDDRNFAIAFFENEVNVVFPNTIGQYTGLMDKNGKEIYEGDIIRSFDSDGDAILHYIVWEEVCFVALYKGRCFRSKCPLGQGWLDEFDKEVIGNIYDDPELVEG